MLVLVTQAKALLRWSWSVNVKLFRSLIQAGELSIDPATGRGQFQDHWVDLNDREFLLLCAPDRRAGSTLDKDAVVELVWGRSGAKGSAEHLGAPFSARPGLGRTW